MCTKTTCEEHLDNLTLEAKQARDELYKLKPYFTSTNSVKVERATIKAKDFWAVVEAFDNINFYYDK